MKDGGPAFPAADDQDPLWHPGMSLRDYFAAAALTGMVGKIPYLGENDEGFDPFAWDTAARSAYDYADAMLQWRERGRA